MGAECVRLSPKISTQKHYKRDLHTSKIRASDEILQFQLIISDLELQCTANNVGKVVFSVENQVNLEFTRQEFFLLDKMIRCIGQKRASFSVHAKNIQFLQFKVSILDTKGAKIEKVTLKMHAVCQGPKLHDHLLKQMKARIVYNLEITQLVSASLGCSDFKIYDSKKNDISQDYGLSLDMIIPDKDSLETDEKKILFSRNPEEQQKYFKNNIPSKKLKQSLFRIIIHKVSSMGFYPQTNLEPQIQICIPYMKFWNQDDMSVISQKNGEKVFQKVNLKYYQKIKDSNDSMIDIYLDLNLKTSKIYLQQIECLIFSQNGLKTVSPYLLSNRTVSSLNNAITPRDLELYENLFKKQRKVTYQTKNQIQKSIKDCYNYLFEQGKTKICQLSDLQIVQTSMLNILNSLSQLITQGQDVTNQSIWLLIDKIIHRPQLSTNYLYLIQNPLQKTQIGLKYYGFLFAMLSKIILCTTMGLTYHELKCIQKFIGYVYFRLHWVQDLVINALKRKQDPQFTNQKMMQIGVYINNKSPSKSVVYDWQQCLLPHVKNDPRYRQISNNLLQTSQSVPKWSQLLFNRDDDDLYYGLIIQIWNEAQIFLNNHGRIIWQYFPNYAQLLGTFLGEMNKNKIMDYSSLFSQCSMKLISNEKLLNNFVMYLFPKTCLYETYCVIKCLQLINSYFQAISKKNKKMPNQFNFNYFYTGIRCIFQSNHSYLLIRVIGLLYDYYHIFSMQFKKSLDTFILSKGFNQIFLHWCGYARKMFYLLLEHRINIKYRQQQGLLGGFNTLNTLNSLNTSNSLNLSRGSLSFEGIQRIQQYKNLIDNLQNQQKKILKQKKCQINMQKSQYYLKMKQKLSIKKIQKKQQQYKSKIQKQSQNILYTSIDFQQQYQLVRKNTHWISSQQQLPKTNRKWSTYNEQQNINQISNEFKKYIVIAMKQYREIKILKNPDEEVKKIMKIFNNNKTIDN